MMTERTASFAGSDLHAVAPVPASQEAALFNGILEQTRDLVCERLDEAIACMLDKADEALSASLTDTMSLDERRIHEEARELATGQRETIETEFQERFFEEFQRSCNKSRKLGERFSDTDCPMDQLELVGTDDLDETLKFNDMAAKLRAYCEDELVALDQRIGVLLGDANLQANDNPLSPQVICDAFKHACRALDADLTVRRVLIRLFDDHVIDDIRSIYKAANALLVRHSILPKIRYGISRDPNRKPPAPGAGPAAAEAAEEPASPPLAQIAAQDLFSVLQRLAAGHVSGAAAQGGAGAAILGTADPAAAAGGTQAAAPGGVILQGAELLASLTRIQRGDLSGLDGGKLAVSVADPGTINVLHGLKATSVGAGMGQLDSLTLDIIAMLFDQLFDDPKVPNGVKGLIGRLQIPMLKVAIADKSFFSTKTHPARRLLDTVGELALRLPADFGPASAPFERLQGVLQELVDGFQEGLEPFAAARERLAELLAAEDRRIEEETKAEAKRVEEMENLALAKAVAQQEIRARVQSQRLPLAIVDFLAQQWLKLLLLVHAKEGKEGRAWTNALALMDQLIWSVAPKQTAEDRSMLGKVVPKLIKNLETGMRFIGTEDAVREKFFAELMKCHTQAISPPPATTEARAPAAAIGATLRGAPRKAAPQERSLDFSAPVTVKNPYGDGEVKVESHELDFTAAEIANRARARREESIRRALDTLGMGTWVEFADPQNPAVRRPARLIFVSPRKTRYLFAVDRAGKQIIQCSRAEIGRRLRLGEAVKLETPPEESLFDRIMNALLGKLGGSGRPSLLPT